MLPATGFATAVVTLLIITVLGWWTLPGTPHPLGSDGALADAADPAGWRRDCSNHLHDNVDVHVHRGVRLVGVAAHAKRRAHSCSSGRLPLPKARAMVFLDGARPLFARRGCNRSRVTELRNNLGLARDSGDLCRRVCRPTPVPQRPGEDDRSRRHVPLFRRGTVRGDGRLDRSSAGHCPRGFERHSARDSSRRSRRSSRPARYGRLS